jgi:hypothetical protein
MYQKMWLAMAVSLTLTASAEAQIFRNRTMYGGPGVVSPAPSAPQYYVGPGGTLYAMPSGNPGIVYGGPLQSTDACCPCPPGPGRCHDDCTNPPRIIYKPYNCPPTEDCKPIEVTITPGPKPDCVEIPFYCKCIDFKFTEKVPVRVIECEEIIRFKDYTIDLKCCEITVCVPCERCIVKREKCELRPLEVKIHACRRTKDKTIDVYALDVPGMPTNYVLHLRMSEDEFKKAYPGIAPPVCP